MVENFYVLWRGVCKVNIGFLYYYNIVLYFGGAQLSRFSQIRLTFAIYLASGLVKVFLCEKFQYDLFWKVELLQNKGLYCISFLC